MSKTTSEAVQNRVLAALPSREYERLEPHLKQFEASQGQILYQQGDTIDYVYFPTSGFVSLVTVMQDGASVEVGVVGRLGMVGVPIVLDDNISPSQAIVQLPGGILRLPAKILQETIEDGSILRTLLHRFIVARLKQTSQTAACNSNHRIDQRLAYWLLTCQDAVEDDRLRLTQEFIAQMLGVRRTGVGEAAIALQSRGLIRYSRGDITILDRKGLMDFSCECYGVVSREFQRLLGDL